MGMELLVAGVFLAGIGVLLFQGYSVLLAFAMPRLDPATVALPSPAPRVSVVIAARNEEHDLPGCLDDLLRQTLRPVEILVVDGGSTDRTVALARARAPLVRVIEEPPLPPGWVGKSWACQVGADAAVGDLVLFLDADVRCHPSTLATVVAWAQREGAALATLAPKLETVGIWERVVLPFMAQMVLTYFRTPRVNRPRSRAAMANGQFTLVRREAYRSVGGHAAIRSAVLEDVRLAEEFRRHQLPMRVAFAPELIATRMYRDRHEMFEGLLKNVHGTRFSLAQQVGFLAGLVGFFWAPFLVLPVGIWWGSWPLALLGAVLVVALFVKHAGFAKGMGGRRVDGLLFPVAVGYYVALVLVSIRRGIARRPIVWKGRAYPMET